MQKCSRNEPPEASWREQAATRTKTLRGGSFVPRVHLHSVLSDSPGGDDVFEVDRRSGDIRTTGRPLTPSKEYLLQVQAVDGHGRKGSPATVAVLAGYRPPQFTNATYSLSVPENTAVGQT